MVKVKIIKTNQEWEKPYLGKIYEAIRTKKSDGSICYIMAVENGQALMIDAENIEVIYESTNKILIVEDGSVDTDELAEWCCDNNIKLIIYRHGANKPEFLNY